MVENRTQLEQVLRGRLGAAFARHAYGMRRWVDLFAVRIPEIRDAYLAELIAEIVHNNARHARLFRERAIAHGVKRVVVVSSALRTKSDLSPPRCAPGIAHKQPFSRVASSSANHRPRSD